MSDFTSEMKRQRNETTSQARLREFGEDVKKRLRFLSEVVLRTVKRRLACPAIAFGDGGRLRSPFSGKKNGERDGTRTRNIHRDRVVH